LTFRSRPLALFDGPALYVDTMLLVGQVDALSRFRPAAEALFGRTARSTDAPRLVTATLTIDEAVFSLMQDLLLRPPYGIVRSRSQYLTAHAEVVRELMERIDGPIAAAVELLALEPVLPVDIARMRHEMAATGLLPRDAIHVAVMRRLGITAIASDDPAFDRCAGLVRYAP
jgi:predicted nucleic acid-binding protein